MITDAENSFVCGEAVFGGQSLCIISLSPLQALWSKGDQLEEL